MKEGLISAKAQPKAEALPPEMQKVADAAAGKVKDQDLLDRFIIAGQRYMFQPKVARSMMVNFGQSGDPLRETGTGIAAMTLVVAQRASTNGLSGDVLAAGGVALLMHALDALAKAGKIQQPTTEELGNACQIMIEKLLDLMKIDGKMIAGLAEKGNALLNDPQKGPALRAQFEGGQQ